MNEFIVGDATHVLKWFNPESVDLTITSPPYDALRHYHDKNHKFDFEGLARELLRVTKWGGIVVWIIGDEHINGDESGSSFRQALHFKKIGFRLLDTMIFSEASPRYPDSVRYYQCFQYMFILKKGSQPHTFNQIKDIPSKSNLKQGFYDYRNRQRAGHTTQRIAKKRSPIHARSNVWTYNCGFMMSTKFITAYNHPAIFPDKLAEDHIKSWSNEGDVVLDPLCGSGTTCQAAHKLRRRWIGIDINESYIEIAKARMDGDDWLKDTQKAARLI